MCGVEGTDGMTCHFVPPPNFWTSGQHDVISCHEWVPVVVTMKEVADWGLSGVISLTCPGVAIHVTSISRTCWESDLRGSRSSSALLETILLPNAVRDVRGQGYLSLMVQFHIDIPKSGFPGGRDSLGDSEQVMELGSLRLVPGHLVIKEAAST